MWKHVRHLAVLVCLLGTLACTPTRWSETPEGKAYIAEREAALKEQEARRRAVHDRIAADCKEAGGVTIWDKHNTHVMRCDFPGRY